MGSMSYVNLYNDIEDAVRRARIASAGDPYDSASDDIIQSLQVVLSRYERPSLADRILALADDVEVMGTDDGISWLLDELGARDERYYRSSALAACLRALAEQARQG